VGEKCPVKVCLNADFHVTFRDLLHAVKLRHGTDGFTSSPKEGLLRIFFFALKIRRFRPGANPANLGTSRPPKPLWLWLLPERRNIHIVTVVNVFSTVSASNSVYLMAYYDISVHMICPSHLIS